MAKKCTYKLKFRRRREQKTNYTKRLALIKAKKPRLVVRRTNRYVISQVILFNETGDRTIVHVNSAMLKKFGWKFNAKNLPAAYLTGLLCGVRAKSKNIGEAVLDVGRFSSTKTVFACLKGFTDAGIKVAYDEKIIPNEERLKGKHIQEFRKINIVEEFEKVKSNILRG